MDEISIKTNSDKSYECADPFNLSIRSQIENEPNSIENQLDIIFNSNKSKSTNLSSRRDVINKVILRGFKKFFVKLFESNNFDRKSSSKLKSRSKVLSKAKSLGLFNSKESQDQSRELENLVYWMSFPKVTKKVIKLFKNSYTSMSLLNDVISNYSHCKLDKILNDKIIMRLFGYFTKFGKEKFMQGIKNFKQNQNNLGGLGNNM